MLVTLFSARIIYGLHRINISLHTLGHFLTYLSKMAQELRLEALCHWHCACNRHLYGLGKLFWYNLCNPSKYAGNHHYCTFGCFNVLL